VYTYGVEFTWDDVKNVSNYRKHQIWFEEAVSVFEDLYAKEIPDPEHSEEEERWIILGLNAELNLLVVVYVERLEGELIRIISARRATRSEEDQYIGRSK
jgi:uncharacterized DUF497 family protein